MSLIWRALREYGALFVTLEPKDFAKAVVMAGVHAPAILRSRKLVPIDEAMSSDIAIKYRGKRFQVPVATIDRMLRGQGDSATFGTVREMFANDVYLRAFDIAPPYPNVVDLGSNRGFFMAIAHHILGATRAVGVEPNSIYDPISRMLANCNGMDLNRFRRETTSIGVSDGDSRISFKTLMQKHSLDRVQFLKCDIEGAEGELFTQSNEFLDQVDNIAAEVHPSMIGAEAVGRAIGAIRDHGFETLVVDQFGFPVKSANACYLYASRQNALRYSDLR